MLVNSVRGITTRQSMFPSCSAKNRAGMVLLIASAIGNLFPSIAVTFSFPAYDSESFDVLGRGRYGVLTKTYAVVFPSSNFYIPKIAGRSMPSFRRPDCVFIAGGHYETIRRKLLARWHEASAKRSQPVPRFPIGSYWQSLL